MNAALLENERLADLLVSLETEGLGVEEDRELERLLMDEPGAERDALAQAASAVALALRLPMDPLPPSLNERLVEQGSTWVRYAAASKVAQLPRPGRPSLAFGSQLGWYAAAASLLLAVAAWWPRVTTSGAPPVIVPEAPAVPTLAEQRESLMRNGAGVLVSAWTATDDPASRDLQGDVVWDEGTQTGYMRFAGLPANDPAQEQYQLWIFDATRDERHPVDGGVFDIPAGGGEVLVPIDARLPVRDAALFAVTVEKPGGVVVSSRERIVAVAQVAAG